MGRVRAAVPAEIQQAQAAGHRGRYRNPDESVQRQLRLIRAYAAEHGLNLPDELIYRDNGRSAWKPGNRRRTATGTGCS